MVRDTQQILLEKNISGPAQVCLIFRTPPSSLFSSHRTLICNNMCSQASISAPNTLNQFVPPMVTSPLSFSSFKLLPSSSSPPPLPPSAAASLRRRLHHPRLASNLRPWSQRPRPRGVVVQAGLAPVLAAAPGREREGRREEGEEGEGKGAGRKVGEGECQGI
jgi:hypothetical protein